MPEGFLTAKEVAEYLGISEKEVKNLVAKGKLPAYKIGGAFLRFKREHVDAAKNRIFSPRSPTTHQHGNLFEKVVDFLYFSDFYIVSFFLIIALFAIIIYF